MVAKTTGLWILVFFLSMGFSACSLVFTSPDEIGEEERDRMFLDPEGMPVSAPVEVYFNEYRVPFIIARNDQDLAFAIGYVQAYMRLEQMTLFKMASQGRLSEIGGFLATDVDHTLRIINAGKVVPEIIKQMPPASRDWIGSYVNGVNAYIDRLKEPTPEMRALNLPLEKWTEEEMVTWWRTASLDVNLVMILMILRESENENWKKIWGDLFPEQNLAAFGGGNDDVLTDELGALKLMGEAGSNSVVVGKSRSKTGAGLIASDPHVGLNLPPLWILMGVSSPTTNAVGYFVSGTPLMVLGRNRDIAWGGTNMWGISSYLYKLDSIDPGQIASHTETIRVRAGLDVERTVRSTPMGPILSDSPYLQSDKPVILKWEGHQVSDEVTTMLKVMHATNWKQFHDAFSTYAVPAMNLLYTDTKGNTGHIPAIRKPVRKNNRIRLPFSKEDNPVVHSIPPTELPFVYNPPEGYIVSTNNNLDHLDDELGWFFPSSSRFRRFQELFKISNQLDREDLMGFQQDVISTEDRETSHRLAIYIRNYNLSSEPGQIPVHIIQELEDWDGNYQPESSQALTYELMLFHLATPFFQEYYQNEDLAEKAMRMSKWKQVFLQKIQAHPLRQEWIEDALKKTAEGIEEHKNWGSFRRQSVRHPLGMIPVIGSSYRFGSYPAKGGSETILKRGGSSSDEPNDSSFGSNARHISDLSDPDLNFFVMYGGNDGYVRSPFLTNHMDLWQEGKYFQVPLDPEKIRILFHSKHTISPSQSR